MTDDHEINAATIHKQAHQPITFGSGVFRGSQTKWSTAEKEAYAIVVCLTKNDHILLHRKGFHLFTDHRNLIFMFSPTQEVKKHVSNKLQRCALRMLNYRYTVHHIAGEDNQWADLLSRWGLPKSQALLIKRINFTRSLLNDEFQWPTLEDIKVAQDQHSHDFDTERQHLLKKGKSSDDYQLTLAEKPNIQELNNKDELKKLNNKIWIPSGAIQLINKICIIAHAGSSGHRGIHATTKIIDDVFSIKHLPSIVKRFMDMCLNCKHIKGGKIIPRPWSCTLTAKYPNEVLHFDWFYAGKSNEGVEWCLFLSCGYTGFVDITTDITPNKEALVKALLNWHAWFTIPNTWVSDCGSHMKNHAINTLRKRLKTNHQFTLPYMHWQNSVAERRHRDALQIFRVMCMELKIDLREWPTIVPLVKYCLNHTPVNSLGGRTPAEVFTKNQSNNNVKSAF